MVNLKKEQKVLAVVLVLLLLSGISFISHRRNANLLKNAGFVMDSSIEGNDLEERENPFKELAAPRENETKRIAVHIEGAVAVPGIYYMEEGFVRVNDVLLLAGGFTDDADRKRVNLAKIVSDEEFIYVPEIGEEADLRVFQPVEPEGREISGKININHASLEELMSLSGIGEAYGNRIIQYRESNGSFASIEEITNVSGIGPVTFDNIKDHITVGD